MTADEILAEVGCCRDELKHIPGVGLTWLRLDGLIGTLLADRLRGNAADARREGPAVLEGLVARLEAGRDLAIREAVVLAAELHEARAERDAAREDAAHHWRSVLDLRRAVAGLVIG